jgi:hypothetical protein
MTQEQFLINLYELATAIVNSLTTLLQEAGPYAGTVLEIVSDLLLAADVALYWAAFGVCLAA